MLKRMEVAGLSNGAVISDEDVADLLDDMTTRELFQRLADQVSELHQDRGHVLRAFSTLEARLEALDGRVQRLEGKPEHERLSLDLSDFEFEDTAAHRIYRIPKAQIRAELDAREQEKDAETWRGVREFFKKNTLKLLGHAFTVIVTAIVLYALHRMKFLPE